MRLYKSAEIDGIPTVIVPRTKTKELAQKFQAVGFDFSTIGRCHKFMLVLYYHLSVQAMNGVSISIDLQAAPSKGNQFLAIDCI